ncbi:MAG: diacylglycerol kinase family lipid kinase [Nannocystaceae bacterium]|nr:diacylglycerol kinase family lipid kinase [Myxococcales bacterium]
MSASSFVVIFNPAAGGGRCAKLAPDAFDRLRDAGLSLEIVRTQGPGDGVRLAREARDAGHRDFIAVGGDGTSYEIVNGLLSDGAAREGEAPYRLGFLPMGTGNSFLRDFTDRGAEHAIEAILADRHRPCDAVRVEHEDGVLHFINIFSIGFVADVAALRNRRFARLGELGYVVAVVAKVANLSIARFPHQLDDGPRDEGPSVFLSINNSKFTGGKMMMAPAAETDDGAVDIIRVGPMSRATLLATFPKIFKGTHVDHPAVTSARAREVRFDLDGPLDVMIDGELLTFHPRRLEVLPAAIEVFA